MLYKSINMNNKMKKLENGFKFTLLKTPTKTITGRLRIKFGALDEYEDEYGLAHLLEHVIMTGGNKKYSVEQSSEIRSLLHNTNAHTSHTQTTFTIDTLSENFELFLDYISNCVFNPIFNEEKIEEEKKRVLREIADIKSSADYNDFQKYQETYYGKNSQFVYKIFGDENTIKKVDSNKLKKIHDRGYSPNNMDLIIVGDIPNNAEELINKFFSAYKAKKINKKKLEHFKKLERKTELFFPASDLINHFNISHSSGSLNICFPAPKITEDEYIIAYTLFGILGGVQNSRLFKNISQEKGLAYNIGARYFSNNRAGTIEIYAKLIAEKKEEGINAIFNEIKKLREELITHEELKKFKNTVKYVIAKIFENNSGHCSAIQDFNDYGIIISDTLKRLDKITPESLQLVAKKYFPKDRKNGKYVLIFRDPLMK